MSLLQKKIVLLAVVVISLFSLASPVFAAFDCGKFAGVFKVTLDNGKDINTIGGLPQICSAADVGSIVIKTLFGFAGIASVIFIMIGGYWYLTAAGNEEQSEKGRKALTSAIMGLAIILMSYAIVTIVANFITSKGAGSQVVSTSQTTTAQTSGSETPISGDTTETQDKGTRLSNDPTNMYYYITDVDVRNNANDVDGIDGTIQYPSDPSQGGQFISLITRDNTKAILNVYKFCGTRMDPSFGFFSLGTARNDVVIKPYYPSGDGWVSDPQINRALESGETLKFQVCGQPIGAAVSKK